MDHRVEDFLNQQDADEEYARHWSQQTIDRLAAWLDDDSLGADVEKQLEKDRIKNTWERYLETREQLWCNCGNELTLGNRERDEDVCDECR